MLDTKGKGHYVGTVLAVRTRSPAWFGEGDEKIYIDGEAKPSIWGTGTEDYFLSRLGPEEDQHALLRRALLRPVGHRRRPHQRLPLAPQRSDRLQHGHQGDLRALRLDLARREPATTRRTSWNEREDDYSSVAFWYQTGEPTFTARAPHARERTLPSLERVTVLRARFRRRRAPRRRRGRRPSSSTSTTARSCSTSPSRPRAPGSRSRSRSKKKEPLRLLLNLTKSLRLRPVPGLPQRREARRRDRPLQRQGRQRGVPPARLLARAGHATRCGWNASARTASPRATTCGIESVRLRERRPRVTQYGFDRDRDWRSKPTLY